MFRNIAVAFRRTGKMLIILSLMICNKVGQKLLSAEQHRSVFQQVYEQSVHNVNVDDVTITFDDWRRAFGGWESVKQVLSNHFYSLTFLYRWIDVDDRVPNVTVARLVRDGETDVNWAECRLRDYLSETRPLVVCFASCACGPFVAKLGEFAKVALRYRRDVDFVMLYTWDVTSPHVWHTARTKRACMAERVASVRELAKSPIPFPLLLDLPTDEAAGVFQANPDRLCVLADDRVRYLSPKTQHGFDVSAVETWIRDYLQKRK